MGLLARIKSLFSSSPGGESGPGNLFAGLFQVGEPPKRGTQELLQAYARLPFLHSVISRIGLDVANLDFEVLQLGPKRSTSKAKRLQKYVARAAAVGRRAEQVREMVNAGDILDLGDHPFLDLLAQPNPALRGMVFLDLVQKFLDLKGEAPIIIERDARGMPSELWPFPPYWLRETATPLRPFYRFGQRGWNYDVPANDVLFPRHPDLENPYGRGAGQGQALGDELDIDEFAAQHLKTWFFNRALPDAFISVEGVTSKQEAERYEQTLRNKHQGVGRGGQIHVTNGKVNVQTLSQTFKDQQLTELRIAQRDTVLQAFNVPPEVMGIVENSNRATIESAFFLYARVVLCPRADLLCDFFTPLLQEWGDRLFLSYESPVPEDRDFKVKVMTAQPTCFSRNEWRCAAGFGPRDGWDDEFPANAPGTVAVDGATGVPSGDPSTMPPATPLPPDVPNEPIEEAVRPLRLRAANQPR